VCRDAARWTVEILETAKAEGDSLMNGDVSADRIIK
jgi:hypothetical protein